MVAKWPQIHTDPLERIQIEARTSDIQKTIKNDPKWKRMAVITAVCKIDDSGVKIKHFKTF
jgi:hypothetical protein